MTEEETEKLREKNDRKNDKDKTGNEREWNRQKEIKDV